MEGKPIKKLSFWDCMGFCIGQIIGSGVMVLTGVIIGTTGHGAPWAFIAGAIIAFMAMLPKAILVSALPASGAKYTHVSKLLSPKAGFFYLCCSFVSQVLIATFALGFASYFIAIFPQFNERVVALVILALAVGVNFIGLKTSALVQKLMVALLLVSLFIFVAFGLPKVQWSELSLTLSNVMPGGFQAFLLGAAFASFASGGAGFIAENADSVENPGKNIPRAMFISTLIVSVFYALVGIVASGVLPLDQVAYQNLTLVAKEIFPPWLYIFFVVGGSWFALATTLNGTLAAVPRGLQAAAKQGWLPEGLAKENRRGAPVYLLILFGVLGAIPIITGMDIKIIASMGVGLDAVCELIYIIAAFYLVKKFPKEAASAPFRFKSSTFMYVVFAIAGLVMSIAIYVDLSELTAMNWLCVGIYMVAAVLFTHFRHKHVIKIHEQKGASLH